MPKNISAKYEWRKEAKRGGKKRRKKSISRRRHTIPKQMRKRRRIILSAQFIRVYLSFCLASHSHSVVLFFSVFTIENDIEHRARGDSDDGEDGEYQFGLRGRRRYACERGSAIPRFIFASSAFFAAQLCEILAIILCVFCCMLRLSISHCSLHILSRPKSAPHAERRHSIASLIADENRHDTLIYSSRSGEQPPPQPTNGQTERTTDEI